MTESEKHDFIEGYVIDFFSLCENFAVEPEESARLYKQKRELMKEQLNQPGMEPVMAKAMLDRLAYSILLSNLGQQRRGTPWQIVVMPYPVKK